MAIIGDTNITMSTIRDTLNGAGGSVGNNLQSFFSSAAKLNMWSKYKPVVISKVPFINLWDNAAYKGDNKQCGITIPIYSNYTTLQTSFKSNSGHYWSYNPPTGGENAPQRLSDFRRYNTNAINPIGDLPGSLAVTRISGTDYLDLSVEVNVQNGHATNLSLSDISVNGIALSNMYLGVYLVRKSGGKNDYFRTTSTTISTNSKLDMRIPLSYDEAGTYTAYMFLSNVKQENNPSNGTLVSLNKVGREVKIVGAGTYYAIIKTFYYEVTLKNNSATAITFNNVYVRIKHNGQNEGNALLVASSKTVSANSSAIISGTGTHSVVFDSNGVNSGAFKIYAYSTSPSLTSDDSPMDLSSPE